MATYEEIYGKRVKEFDSDPTLDSSYEGQVWYDKSSGTLRTVTASIAAWSSGSPLIKARGGNSGKNMGTQTAGIVAGGQTSTLPTVVTDTEEYNGSGWTSGGALGTARGNQGGAGTQTAALIVSGNTGGPPIAGALNANVEEYNGTSWSEQNNIPTSRADHMAFGPQTAALASGGIISTATITNTSAEYDGTNWTTGGAMGTSREYFSGAGTVSAGVVSGGVPPITANVEEYDGTSFSEVNNLPAARQSHQMSGIQTASMVISGYAPPSPTTSCLFYDGTNFSTAPSVATARTNAAGAGGTPSATLFSGGSTPPGYVGNTEEFTQSINTITAGAFASSPTLSYSVDANLASAGSLTSAVAAGGYNSPAGPGTVSYIAKAATWNGTAWSNITDLPERRTNNNSVGDTAPAFYVFGGQNQPGPSTNTYLTTTYTWNGSAWGSAPSLAESQSGGGACGTPSAIVLVGGVNAPSSGSIDDNIQQYDGSSWANSPVNYPTNISGNGCVGTQTAAVIFGGYAGGSPFPSSGVTTTNEWNGSSISSANAMVFGLLGCSGSGTQTAALSYGGRNTAGNKNAIGMIYDGTSWATQPSLSTARDYIGMGPMGSATNCLAVTGSGGAQSLVEEFTAESSAVTASTLTSS